MDFIDATRVQDPDALVVFHQLLTSGMEGSLAGALVVAAAEMADALAFEKTLRQERRTEIEILVERLVVLFEDLQISYIP